METVRAKPSKDLCGGRVLYQVPHKQAREEVRLLGQKPPVFFQLFLSPNMGEANYSRPLLLQYTRNEPSSGISTPGLEPHHCP